MNAIFLLYNNWCGRRSRLIVVQVKSGRSTQWKQFTSFVKMDEKRRDSSFHRTIEISVGKNEQTAAVILGRMCRVSFNQRKNEYGCKCNSKMLYRISKAGTMSTIHCSICLYGKYVPVRAQLHCSRAWVINQSRRKFIQTVSFVISVQIQQS